MRVLAHAQTEFIPTKGGARRVGAGKGWRRVQNRAAIIVSMTSTRDHEFTCFHLAARALQVVPTLATLATIAAVGGRVVKHSGQDVPSGLLDEMGFYPRPALGVVLGIDPQAYLISIGFRASRAAIAA